jgi:flagellar hook-associated protein FlgK
LFQERARAPSRGEGCAGGYTGLQATFGSTTQSFKASGGSLSVLDPTVTSAAIEAVRSQLDAVAGQLIDSVNSVYYATQDGALDTPVEKANELLSSIANFNEEIVAMEAETPGSSTALQAERQAAMDELAKILKFESTTETDGSGDDHPCSDAYATSQTLVSGATAAPFPRRRIRRRFLGLKATFDGTTKSFG